MTINEILHQWLIEAAPDDVPVIRRDQNNPVPPRTFVAWKCTLETREGEPSYQMQGADGDILVQHGALINVALSVFGPDAWEIAGLLRSSLTRPSVMQTMRGRGLVYVRILMGPADATQIIGTTFEERVVIDAQFRTNVAIVDNTGLIEQVELTGNVGPVEIHGITGEM